MTTPALVTVGELAAWLGATIDDGDERAVLFLDSASGLVRSEAGRTWLDAEGELDEVPADVRAVTLAVAARAWANPTGQTDRSQGPFRDGWDAASAGLALTDDEKVTLGRYRATGTGGLFTIATTRSDSVEDLPDRYLTTSSGTSIAHVPWGEPNW